MHQTHIILFHILVHTLPSSLLFTLLPYCIVLGAVVLTMTLTVTVNSAPTPSRLDFTSISPLLIGPFFAMLLTLINSSSVSYPLMGHLVITPITIKFYLLFTLMGYSTLVFLRTTTPILNRVSTDLYMFLTAFLYFTPLLFLTNSLLSFVFLIELLTTQIFVLIILWDTSVRERQAIGQNEHSPSSLLSRTPFNALFFFFWTSFIIAVVLFFMLNFILTRYTTTEFIWLECITFFLVSHESTLEICTLVTAITSIFVIIMVKFALAPFFFWKPIFFSALHLPSLFLYTIYFYTALLAWLLLFWFSLNTVLISLVSIAITGLLTLGFIITVVLLSNSTSLRIFIAISSIFNTLLIWFVFIFTDSVMTTPL